MKHRIMHLNPPKQIIDWISQTTTVFTDINTRDDDIPINATFVILRFPIFGCNPPYMQRIFFRRNGDLSDILGNCGACLNIGQGANDHMCEVVVPIDINGIFEAKFSGPINCFQNQTWVVGYYT